MGYNAKEIKEMLTVDNILLIMESINAFPYHYQHGDNTIIFNSVCHNSDSHKLFYYIETQSFFCFSRCSHSYDIFSLLQKVLGLNFMSAIDYVINVCDLNVSQIKCKKHIVNRDNWENDLLPFLKKNKCQHLTKTYDENILNLFDDIYHENWINEGISIDTLQKYNIKWYSLHNSIIIPCYDCNNSLIGIRERFVKEEDCNNGKYKPLILVDNSKYKFPTGDYFYGENFNFEQIKKTKEVMLFESEKATLKCDTWFGDKSIALSMYGSTLGKYRAERLLKLNIERVHIMLDSDFKEIGDDDYLEFEKKVMKIYNLFKGFCKVDVCYNNQNYNGYKFAPVDFTKEQFKVLWKNREEI